MKKSNKRSNVSPVVVHETKNQRAFPFDVPEIVDIDTMSTMTDEDLIVRLRSLDTDRERLVSMGYEPQPWEVELAYLRREQQIRRVRRDLHEKYMRALASDVGAPESSLPYADLDNSAFMGF